MANLTCIYGQMFILDLVSHLEPYCRLLQTNTDGIFILCENEEMKNKCIEITNEVGRRTRMEYEIEEFTKLIQKDVNNYIAVEKSGKLECKGAMVKFNNPLDNDTSILNDAVRNYLVDGTPVEDTIYSCNELIKFQKVIKLSAKFKGIYYGVAKSDGKGKVSSIDGEQLKNKVHRVFASKNESHGAIYKLKMEKGVASYEKYANTPDHLFIDNSDIHGVLIPEYLDKEYYINEAKKRINAFLEKDEETVDTVPMILFECMNKTNNFWEFIISTKENGVTDKILEDYIVADCCSKYGRTWKLLEFKKYFKLLYGKNKMTTSTLEKKFNDDNPFNAIVRSIIVKNAELSKTGKTYNDLNLEKIFEEIFDNIENIHINPYFIMKKQVEKFNGVLYKDESLDDNIWFVLNTRNIIAPNLILYNMKDGRIEYRKIKKDGFRILPIFDGDIIKVKSEEDDYAKKIIGKDEDGVNIISADITKPLKVISSYDLIYRNYEKGSSLINSEG